MDFKNITDLVPENEHFDSSVINEGVWLTSGHVAAIEAALGKQAESVNANEIILGKVNELSKDIEAKETAINDHLATIAALETKVAELGGQSSGAGTVINTKVVESNGAVEVASYLDDNHPINQFADKRLKKSEQ